MLLDANTNDFHLQTVSGSVHAPPGSLDRGSPARHVNQSVDNSFGAHSDFPKCIHRGTRYFTDGFAALRFEFKSNNQLNYCSEETRDCTNFTPEVCLFFQIQYNVHVKRFQYSALCTNVSKLFRKYNTSNQFVDPT